MMEPLELFNKITVRHITSAHVLTVWRSAEVFTKDLRPAAKDSEARALADQFNDCELWLLSFVRWAMSSHHMPIANPDDYVMLPYPAEQQATLYEFVEVIKAYNGRALISKQKEKQLIKFLVRCTEPHRDFYLSLLGKAKFMREFLTAPLMRELVSLHTVTSEDVFGASFLSRHGAKVITYPLVLTTLPKELPAAMIYKTAKYQHVRIALLHPKGAAQTTYRKEMLHHTWLKDRKYIHSNEFILLGRIDVENGKFYALDFFDSFLEYYRHRRGKFHVPHPERLKKLELFAEVNLVYQIEVPPMVYCQTSHTMEQQVAKLIEQSTYPVVAAIDGKNRINFIPTVEKLGLVGGLWKELDEVKGFHVWNNGEVVPCAFTFTGRLKALLYDLSHVYKKPVRFTWFKFAEYSVGAIREIKWNEKSYRKYRFTYLDGVEGLVEKCPLCLRSDLPVDHGALCTHCALLLRCWLKNYGTDVWIRPTPALIKARVTRDWSIDFINRSGLSYKGLWLICDPVTGNFKLTTNETIKAKYEAYREKLKGKDAAQVKDWQKEQRRVDLDGSGCDQTTDICRPAELHEQESVADVG